jgi:outer membrane protein TolC
MNTRLLLVLTATLTVPYLTASAQTQPNAPAAPIAPITSAPNVAYEPSIPITLPHSWEPFHAYAPDYVPRPSLANSPGVTQLIRNGSLYLSLQDAIELALQNNLDIAIARYNLPIAEADIERTKAGAAFRGVNIGIVQNTPGGGVGGFGSGAPGAGAGGTTGGAGGAGSGASGLVQSTLGTGTNVSSFDPQITGSLSVEHDLSPESNLQVYGVPSLQQNTTIGDIEYTQAFPTGTSFTVDFDNSRATENGPDTLLTPSLSSYYRVTLNQPLLAGFGLGPNLRYLRIARNNKRISDVAFRSQLIATIDQIATMYWDLVNAYQDEQVKQQSYNYAQQALNDDREELKLEAIPRLDVTKAEGELAARDGDLSVAKVNLEFQESLIKNALTRNLDDPILEAVPVIPTDHAEDTGVMPAPLESLIATALQQRPELSESSIDLENRDISRRAARNALLPSASVEAFYGGTGLAGLANPLNKTSSTTPTSYGGAVSNAFNNSSPDYLVALNVSIPLRNRVAKSDQYRSELEYRQAGLRQQELLKQIRIEVRNAAYALEQSAAHLKAASDAEQLAQQSFETTQKEQKLGAASALDSLAAQHELALRQSDVAAAAATYEKSRVELDRATGQTLASYHVSLADAKTGSKTGADQQTAATSTIGQP